jgi:hypothetical protein
MKFNAQDALDVAAIFREAAKAVGDYLYEEWNDLSPADINRLRPMYVTLMNVATDLATHAVGIVIDEGQVSLAELSGAAKEATDAFQNIADAKKAIVITTALIDLAVAIPTENIETIVAAFQNLQKVTST